MPGIPSKILNPLRKILSDCEQFDTNRSLRNMFIDERIKLWKNRLPQANAMMDRVDTLINYLYDKKNSDGVSGLILFLEVLADSFDSLDFRHAELSKIIKNLSQEYREESNLAKTNGATEHIWTEKFIHNPELEETDSQSKITGVVTPNILSFFISYNRHDKQIAEWIAWQLEEAGYTTVIQAWDFRPGGNFVVDMQNAAANAERTIAVLSPDYLASQFTQPEWNAAFAQDPTGKDGLLLPVRVRECELTGLLPQIVYIDLVGLEEEDAKITLLNGVKQGRAKPDSKPNFSTS